MLSKKNKKKKNTKKYLGETIAEKQEQPSEHVNIFSELLLTDKEGCKSWKIWSLQIKIVCKFEFLL